MITDSWLRFKGFVCAYILNAKVTVVGIGIKDIDK